MYGVMTLYEVSLLCYQKRTNSAVKRNLVSVINNWHDSSACFSDLVKSYIFSHDQYDLSTWVTNIIKIKITNNCFNFIWI